MSKRMGVACVMIFAVLMVSVTRNIRGQEYTEKSYCMFAIGYNSSVEDLKKELLANAKRLAVNEIFGELIASFTTVDNFTLTEDVIRSSSAGYIRVRGVPVFKNGDHFGEVCVSIQAYATETDKDYLRPKRVRKKSCSSDRNLTTPEIKEYARQQTIVSALVDYERKLEDVDRKILLELIHRITYHESAFVPDTETYCVELEGFVYPIEILALTSRGEVPIEISKSTGSSRDMRQEREVDAEIAAPPSSAGEFLSRPLPQTWKGTFIQFRYGEFPWAEYSMALHLEKVHEGTIVGKINWPTLNFSVTSINGGIVDFDDLAEQDEWRPLKKKVKDGLGVWLRFTEDQLISGSGIVLHLQYYAHLSRDGVMRGICYHKDSITQAGEFLLRGLYTN